MVFFLFHLEQWSFALLLKLGLWVFTQHHISFQFAVICRWVQAHFLSFLIFLLSVINSCFRKISLRLSLTMLIMTGFLCRTKIYPYTSAHTPYPNVHFPLTLPSCPSLILLPINLPLLNFLHTSSHFCCFCYFPTMFIYVSHLRHKFCSVSVLLSLTILSIIIWKYLHSK